MARDFAERRDSFLRKHSDQEGPSSQYSKERGDIARGKRPELVDEDPDNLSEPEEAANPKVVKKQGRKPRPDLTEADFYEALSNMEFSGTRYLHPEIMVALGINRDVSRLFEECHLGTFMETPFAGYKEETCQFLATLNVHLYEDEQEAVEDGQSADEVGFITFEVHERGHLLLISQLNGLLDFPPGRSTQQNFDKEELQALWNIIAGRDAYSSARSKSSHIRNPAIRYFHKSLANTFFARKVNGNVNEGELQMLDLALLRFLNIGRGDRIFRGDKADAGLTMVLLDQFMSYRDWATKLYRNGKKGELTVGGIITPILLAANVELVTRPYEARWIDLTNLAKQHILEYKRFDNSYIYKFTHPVVGDARLLLPNLPLTKITLAQNVDFWPPVESLYDEQTPIQEDPAGDEAEGEQEPESYMFNDDPPARTLKEANRRISLLQRWNKWQDKTIKALADTIKGMKISIKGLKGKGKHPPVTPGLRRTSSLSSMTRRRARVDPPRRSAVEPRQRKRRAMPLDAGESSVRGLGQQTEFSVRRSDSMPGRVRQPEFYTEAPTSSAAVPDYTRDSMDEYTTQFFTNP